MKRTILAIAVLVGVSIANVSVASNGIKIVDILAAQPVADLQVEALKDLKFKLTVDKLGNKSYIAIKSQATGEIMYSEFVSNAKANSYSKVFDLSNLADGNYVFVVENGTEKMEKPFVISTEVKRTAIPLGN
ncbi:MAG: hypothetical protein ACK4R6_13970 [Spirosomataceae bacterium]